MSKQAVYFIKHKSYKKLYGIILLMIGVNLFSQNQPSFTQYMFNESFINPAYVGSQDALSLTGVYRNQWSGVEGAPLTQTLAAHTPLLNKKIGIGISLLNEQIGVYNKSEAYVNYAYRIHMKNSILSLGLLGGAQSVRELYSKVKTTQAHDVQFMYDSPRFIMPNFGVGMYYYTPGFYAGISVPRLVKSQFYNGQRKATARIEPNNFTYYTVVGYVININEKFKLKPSVMIKNVSGAPVQSEATLMAFIRNAVWLGASYRSKHSIAGILGFQFTAQCKAVYSYDYFLSDLKIYHLATHEISLNYIFKYNKEKIENPRLF